MEQRQLRSATRLDYQIAASRIRGPRKTGPKPAGMFRVIALGDSFTWGIEAGEDEHFPHYLENILQGKRAAEVFNMAWAATASTRCC